MAKFGIRKALKWTFFVCLAALSLGIGYSLFFPDVSVLKKENPKATALMKYRREMAKEAGKKLNINSVWVPLSSISPYLVHAVVVCEDDKFWAHKGFDFEAIKTALEKDIRKRTYHYGGSTITQQLAKNLFLSPPRNPVRKLRESILAWRLERKLSKKRILELYLNVVEWGDGLFGAEAASLHYYGKPASDLSPREAARLAVVLPSPRRYNPLSNTRYIEERTQAVLEILVKRGIVKPEDAGN
ncbi:MAG: monofunctional biosynthetic peptidoglycan transglycosylase [Acidobacteriota bacterium]